MMDRLRFAPLLILATLILAGCPQQETDKTDAGEGAAPEATGETASAWDTPEGWTAYGAPITLAEATSITDLNAKPTEFADTIIRVEGKVTGVCKGSGCWVEVMATDGSSIIAKSPDHSVQVPKNCESWPVVVQGTFLNMGATTQEAAEHVEEEHHDHEEGGEPHKCPQPIWMLTMDSVELEEAPATEGEAS